MASCRKRRILIASCLLALSATAGLVIVSTNDSESPAVSAAVAATDRTTPSKKRSIGALGRLEPASRIRQVSPWSEARTAAIIELHVEEGENVEVGQILATLDNHERLSAEVNVAKATVATALAKLKQTLAGTDPSLVIAKKAELQAAKSRRAMLSSKYIRSKNLRLNNAVSMQEHDNAKWELDDANHAIERLSGELRAMETVRDVDVSLLKAEVLGAEAELARRKTQLRASRVHAPIDGVVLRIHSREGETVGEEGVLELADTSAMHAVAEVFEADADRIRVGMPAKMKVVSSNFEFRGRVVSLGSIVGRQTTLSIAPVANVDSRVVEVRIGIAPHESVRLSRLSNARVEVVIESTDSKDSSQRAVAGEAPRERGNG
ncbi:MAG: HlyD family efflux transporter periplasmic adaptor subunit [Aureliella sp.]